MAPVPANAFVTSGVRPIMVCADAAGYEKDDLLTQQRRFSSTDSRFRRYDHSSIEVPMYRRSLLALLGTAAIGGVASAATPSTPADTASPFGVRSLGKKTAPVTVDEYFSLTCPHCAEFATHALKKIVPTLVDTGKVYYVFRDFPLDSVALMAAQVARTLPPHAYYPFIEMLFSHQDEWAFDPNLHTRKQYEDALFPYAALAGMDRATFNAAIANKKLRAFILSERKTGEKKYKIDATPTFLIDGKKHVGGMSFAQFTKAVGEA